MIFGALVMYSQLSKYSTFTGLGIIGIGFLILLLSVFLIKKTSKYQYWTIQIILSVMLIIGFSLFQRYISGHTKLEFENEFNGSGGIIFGIAEYPELPDDFLWRRHIKIPESGVIITSTPMEEIRYKYELINVQDLYEKTDYFIVVHRRSINCEKIEIRYAEFQNSNNNFKLIDSIVGQVCDSLKTGYLTTIYKEVY